MIGLIVGSMIALILGCSFVVVCCVIVGARAEKEYNERIVENQIKDYIEGEDNDD